MQFRTKARAVDLLGKGQIADLPTAITELWKNGYDAYADNVSAELYLQGYKDSKYTFFVIADDGKGMAKADIFEKWLVLGTDSKSRIGSQDEEGNETLWKKPRIKAGEKGIGRLSVAFLGSPMLMLTKKQGNPLQALYFDWRLLENYNLFLDDINIPVADIVNEQEFAGKFKNLKLDFLQNFNSKEEEEEKNEEEDEKEEKGDKIWELSQIALKKSIVNSSEKLELPLFFEEEIIRPLINVRDDHGTKFIIFEPEEQVIRLSTISSQSEEDNENDLDYVLKSISGFVNEFKEEKEGKLPLNISFPIHQKIGSDYDFLQQKWKFFTPEDFKSGDILIEGNFDGEGEFDGTIKLYNDEPFEHKFKSSRKKDKRSNYGQFYLKLGYNMGNERESKLDGDSFLGFKKKVDNIGGLYIYRDGFRVLPYGRQDYDFLEFEKRRGLRIGTYFFSHRRMFGFIDIKRSVNPNLKDKASREGLITNAAYLAFKQDLIDFFVELAKEYFATEAQKSLFTNKTEQLRQQNELLKKDKERERQEKSAFTKSLKEYPDRFHTYKETYEKTLNRLQEKLNQSNTLYSEIESLLDDIKKLNIQYDELLPKISNRYKPTDTQLERLSNYESEIIKFNESIKVQSELLIESAQEKLEIRELIKEFEKEAARYKGSLEGSIYSAREILNNKINKIKQEFEERINRAIEEINKFRKQVLTLNNTKEDILNAGRRLRDIYEFQKNQIDNTILPLVEHINRLSFDIDEESLQGVYKEQYEQIKYQWEQTRETAQLGIAVEIIDHEFNQLYASINQSIKRLDLKFEPFLFNNLKQLFAQLEDKYALLSPLYRISGVVPKDIYCIDIFNYISSFFSSKFKEESISFSATNSFKNHKIFIKEPIIHTVFINIVNNAIYWVRNSDKKEIVLDFFPQTEEIIIINSGEKIQDYRLEKIFELFYSTRPNGRGIGLYLSRQSLNESYFDLKTTNDIKYNYLNGACFIIKPLT